MRPATHTPIPGATGPIQSALLPNGVRILCERMPHLKSASVGVYLHAGSRHESEPENGTAHFIEHMLFKGTSRRTGYELSVEQNLLGGNVNAYTTQDSISLGAKVIDRHAFRALDLLLEMLTESTFDPVEFERERGVILEEYKMYDDTPDELVMDRFMEAMYGGHGVGRPILGTPRHLKSFTPDGLRQFAARHFTPDRVVVAAAGNIDPEELISRVEPVLSRLEPRAGGAAGFEGPAPVPVFGRQILERELEQTHFVFGTTGPARTDDRRFAYAVMSAVLGAGPGSRIFEEVREKRGLAYSIGTFEWYLQDGGCIAVGGGTSPETFDEVMQVCRGEFRRLATEPPTPEEVECAKAQIRTSVVLGAESSSSRASRLAEQTMYFGRIIPMEESLEKLDAIGPLEVMDAAREWLLDKPYALSVIGEGAHAPDFDRI